MKPYGTIDDPVANDSSALTPEQQRVRNLFLDPAVRTWRYVFAARFLLVASIGAVAWFLWQYAMCVIRGAC